MPVPCSCIPHTNLIRCISRDGYQLEAGAGGLTITDSATGHELATLPIGIAAELYPLLTSAEVRQAVRRAWRREQAAQRRHAELVRQFGRELANEVMLGRLTPRQARAQAERATMKGTR